MSWFIGLCTRGLFHLLQSQSVVNENQIATIEILSTATEIHEWKVNFSKRVNPVESGGRLRNLPLSHEVLV